MSIKSTPTLRLSPSVTDLDESVNWCLKTTLGPEDGGSVSTIKEDDPFTMCSMCYGRNGELPSVRPYVNSVDLNQVSNVYLSS